MRAGVEPYNVVHTCHLSLIAWMRKDFFATPQEQESSRRESEHHVVDGVDRIGTTSVFCQGFMKITKAVEVGFPQVINSIARIGDAPPVVTLI